MYCNHIDNFVSFLFLAKSRRWPIHINADGMFFNINKDVRVIFVFKPDHFCNCWRYQDDCCCDCIYFAQIHLLADAQLDYAYVCCYRHYIRHAYSGGCSDFRRKPINSEIVKPHKVSLMPDVQSSQCITNKGENKNVN